jgi:hypothetical protein
MNEITEAHSADAEVRETYRWEILKRDPLADAAFVGPVWVNIGSVVTDTSYYLYAEDINAVASLTNGGAGEYLCVLGERVQRVSIVAETVYRRAEEQS